jgi:hypothetical protein
MQDGRVFVACETSVDVRFIVVAEAVLVIGKNPGREGDEQNEGSKVQ